MSGIDGEPEPGRGLLPQGIEQGHRHLDRRSALLAHQMPMTMGGQVVARRAVTEVGMGDHAEALELVQIPIDGRDVHVGRRRLDLLGQFLGTQVPRMVEQDLHEYPAGVGDPAAPRSDQLQHVVDGIDLREHPLGRQRAAAHRIMLRSEPWGMRAIATKSH